METDIIIHEMAEQVINKIYDEWHHDGHIQCEYYDSFDFVLDGKYYRVKIEEVKEV